VVSYVAVRSGECCIVKYFKLFASLLNDILLNNHFDWLACLYAYEGACLTQLLFCSVFFVVTQQKLSLAIKLFFSNPS